MRGRTLDTTFPCLHSSILCVSVLVESNLGPQFELIVRPQGRMTLGLLFKHDSTAPVHTVKQMSGCGSNDPTR
jgi:hypothetical protein